MLVSTQSNNSAMSAKGSHSLPECVKDVLLYELQPKYLIIIIQSKKGKWIIQRVIILKYY